MNDYIAQLHSEHQQLAQSLDQLTSIDITQEDGKRQLFRVMDLLITHIQNEDRELYQVLQEAALKDPEIQTTLKHFASDILELGQKTNDFFNRFRSQGHNDAFQSELKLLKEHFQLRVRKEELVLFELYKEIKNSA